MVLPHHTAASVALALALACLALSSRAAALPAPVGTQAGQPVPAAALETQATHSGGACHVGVPVIGGLLGGACEAGKRVAETVGGLPGEVASTVGNGILDLLAKWMIGAATQVTSFVSRQMQQTTTPQLQSAWYEAQFQPMADLGAALGLLVTLIAFASAAIRRSPEALAATLAGIARAGLGTGLVLALTVIALEIADQVSSAVVSGSPHAFWVTVAHAWGTHGFGGFGSSALATLIAMIEVFAAIFVWLELIARDAAIYLAVLFFPATLAAAIWPALNAWPGRLGRLLMLFVILKPVALIVLSLAGNAAAAGLSFNSGVSGSVGTILAATVIFALAAFAPWTLMYLLAADAESAHAAAGLRTAAASTVTDEDGRSVRSAGGLRNFGSNGGNGEHSGGQPGGGSSFGGGGPGGGGSPSAGGSSSGGGESSGASGKAGGLDGAGMGGAETIGTGSVGAAAGMSVGAPQSSAEPQSQSADVQDTSSAQGGDIGSPDSTAGQRDVGASSPAPTSRNTKPRGGAGEAPGRLSQGSGGGSTGGTDPIQEPATEPAGGPAISADGGSLHSGAITQSLPRAPRGRAPSGSPVLAGVPPRSAASRDREG